jgi:type IVB pilus formation R64 PilN family outer membrane protein
MMKRMMRAIVLATVVALTGCATPMIKQVGKDMGNTRDKAQSFRADMSEVNEGYWRERDEIWLGDTPKKISTEAKLPAAFKTKIGYQPLYPVTLQMIAEYVATITHLPVTVTEDAKTQAIGTAYDPGRAASLRRGDGQNPVAQQRNFNTGAQPGGEGAFTLAYKGTVKGLLDQATARTGNSWRYRDGRITILHFDSRTFQVLALPGSTSINAEITNQSESGSQQGGGGGQEQSGSKTESSSGQSTTIDGEIDVMGRTAESVKVMLSKEGKMATAAGAGTITVTDTPEVLDRVASYITELNKRLTRQVVIDVQVYSVDLSQTDYTGIDWNMIWQTISGRYGISTVTRNTAPDNASSLNFSVLDDSYTYGGSKILFNALSQQGDVSVKTSAGVATLSGQPVPVQVANETTYLAREEANLVANAGVQITRTPGSKTTGFSMLLLPKVLDDNTLLMQVQISLSSLRKLRKISGQGSQLELPEVASRHFLQRVKIRSGNALVLSGFEQTDLSNDAKGIGEPHFTLAGGSRGGARKHTVIVVVITPRVTG